MRSCTSSSPIAGGGASGMRRNSVTAGGLTTLMGPELARSFGGPRGSLRGSALGEDGVGCGGCGRSCEHAAQTLAVLVVHASGGASQQQSATRSSCVYALHRCRLWWSTFL